MKLKLAIVALVVCLAGCGQGLVDVSGQVMLDGEPLTTGTVVFTADDKPMAVGDIGEDGRYSLQTGGEPGVLPGDYRVSVSAYRTRPAVDGTGEPIPELLTPAKYNNAATSGLTATVGGGNDEINLDLSSNLD